MLRRARQQSLLSHRHAVRRATSARRRSSAGTVHTCGPSNDWKDKDKDKDQGFGCAHGRHPTRPACPGRRRREQPFSPITRRCALSQSRRYYMASVGGTTVIATFSISFPSQISARVKLTASDSSPWSRTRPTASEPGWFIQARSRQSGSASTTWHSRPRSPESMGRSSYGRQAVHRVALCNRYEFEPPTNKHVLTCFMLLSASDLYRRSP